MEKRDNIKKLIVYLAVTFVLTFAVEISVCLIKPEMYQLAALAAMFMPTVGTLIANRGLSSNKSGIRWKLQIKSKLGWIAFAWLMPAVFTVLGAVLYFLLIKNSFSPSLQGLVDMSEAQGVEIKDGTINGVPAEMLVLINIVTGVLLGPLLNAIPALGEEIGWRGFMTPTLMRLMSRRKALLLSGVIWGVWHAPLIVLVGYEYGTDYLGAPWLGVAAFCVVTTALGVILTSVYEKTDSILAPAIFHGAFNAIAAAPLWFAVTPSVNMLLGPAPNGILSCIPIIAAAVVLEEKGRGRKRIEN